MLYTCRMQYTHLSVKKEEGYAHIDAEISAEDFASFWEKELGKIKEKATVPGFRKGKAPESVVVKNVGEGSVLEAAAEAAVESAYGDIVKKENLSPVGPPRVTVKKVAKGSPFSFSLSVALMPEVDMCDYKKEAKEVFSEKKENVSVSEKEVDDVITHLRKQHAAAKGVKEDEIKLDDEFARSLGDFKDAADLKKKIKENIVTEKQGKERQKMRMKVMERIAKKSKMTIPDALVEAELDKMMAQFEGDVSRMGLRFDKYLEHVKKTKESLRSEWRSDAERNVKVQIILSEIAKKEHISPDKKRIEEETEKLLEHYRDASPDRAREYVKTVLTNEEVFSFLEKQRPETK